MGYFSAYKLLRRQATSDAGLPSLGSSDMELRGRGRAGLEFSAVQGSARRSDLGAFFVHNEAPLGTRTSFKTAVGRAKLLLSRRIAAELAGPGSAGASPSRSETTSNN
jgi:hypothetical protein